MSILKINDNSLWRSERWQVIPPLPPDPPDPPPTGLGHGEFVTLANTGIAALGLVPGDLTPSGSVTTSSNGQIIEGRLISGQVNVNHHDVTIRGCRVLNPGFHAIKVNNSAGGLLVAFCETEGTSPGNNADGINQTTNATPRSRVHDFLGTTPETRNVAYRCKLRFQRDVVHPSGGWLFLENYMMNGAVVPPAHNDGMDISKLPNSYAPYPSLSVIRNKVITAAEDGSAVGGNSCIWIDNDSGDLHGIEIRQNWLQSGSPTNNIFLSDAKDTPYTFMGSITITDNKHVQGWPVSSPGPKIAISLNINKSSPSVTRSGNRYVSISGVDQGAVPGG
jgi:hypothetical protein